MQIGLRYVVVQAARAVALLVFGMTVVFFVIHFGPAAPADHSALEAGFDSAAELQQQKRAFGLTEPLWKQYGTYLLDTFTLDFGETWAERQVDITESEASNDVNTIVVDRVKRTAWLWLWTLLIAFGTTATAGYVSRSRSDASVALSVGLAGSLPVFLLAILLETGFSNLGDLLFGLDWRGFLVTTPAIARPLPVEELGTADGVLLASKLAIPPALALAVPVAAVAASIWHRSYLVTARSGPVDAARARGLHPGLVSLKHLLPNTLLPTVSVLDAIVVVLIGGTVLVETVFRLDGLGTLLYTSVVRKDYTTLQATMFVFLAVVAGSVFLKRLLQGGLYGVPERDTRERMNSLVAHTDSDPGRTDGLRTKLRPLGLYRGVRSNVRAAPLSAVLWLSGAAFLLALEFGALLEVVQTLLPGVADTNGLPTLLERGNVPNSGYRTATGDWAGTFLGLSPAPAWGLRVLLVYSYAAAWVGWLALGYRIYRDEYRPRPRTQLDDALSRFRNHRVGMFGAFVLFVFLVAAVFAPAVATTPLDQSNAHTSLQGTGPDANGEATVTYFDAEAGTVETTQVRSANFDAASNPQTGVGPLSYDSYGRFHPLGTSTEGTDLLTELLYGARVYFLVAGGGGLLAGLVALALVGVASYRPEPSESLIDGLTDAAGILPVLPFVLFFSVFFYPRLTSLWRQLAVWTLLFGVLGGLRLWKAIGPAVERDDDRVRSDQVIGRSEAQRGARVVRRNLECVLPVVSVCAVTSASGFVVTVAALSYLGHLAPSVAPYGVYEWGTFVWLGENALLSTSSHLFVVPSAAFAVFVAGSYSFAVGLRDALAVEQRVGISAVGEITRLGGGG
jgi:peptide/nickel transport system permease protein